MSFYLENIVPSLCLEGDDQNYGSAATKDVECLQALSQRIHYGKQYNYLLVEIATLIYWFHL
jgi:chorismate mutase